MNEDFEYQKPCKFCEGFSIYSPIEQMDYHGVGVYFCHPCKAEYLYFGPNSRAKRITSDLASTSLYTEINNRTYRWTVNSAGTAGLWRIKEPGTPGQKKNEGLVSIKSFSAHQGDTIPIITPSNVNEKIRTWLTFL